MTNTQIQYENGSKLLSARKLEEAMAAFRDIVESEPEHAGAQFQIGRILLEVHRPFDAILHLEASAHLAPNEPAVWSAWAEAVALGGESRERQIYLKALRNAPVAAKLKLHLQDRFGSNRKGSRPQTGGMGNKQAKKLTESLRQRKFREAENLAKRSLMAHPASALSANVLGASSKALIIITSG